MRAKKFIERYQEGEFEYIKSHVMKVDNIQWYELEAFFDEPQFEDPESAYEKGVVVDYDNEVVWVSVSSFLAWLDSYIEDVKNDKDEDVHYDLSTLQSLRKRLEKYEEHDIYPSEESEKQTEVKE